MEPLAMLSGISTALKAIKDTAETIKWMQGVYESYQNSDKTLHLILIECGVYADSIKAIGTWIEEHHESQVLRKQINSTNNAIVLVKISMLTLQGDLEKIMIGSDRLTIKIFRNNLEVKWQWFVETMKNHLTELRHHSGILQLALQVIQLTRPSETQVRAPERLDSKTKSLEKKLLLRHFLTKALEIRRTEINAEAEKAEHTRLIKVADAPTLSVLKTMPSLYDVAQQARQTSMPPPLPARPENLSYFDEYSEEPDQITIASLARSRSRGDSLMSSIYPKREDASSMKDTSRIQSYDDKVRNKVATISEETSPPESDPEDSKSEAPPLPNAAITSSDRSESSGATVKDRVPASPEPLIISDEKEAIPETPPVSLAASSLFSRTSTVNSGSTSSSGVTKADLEERRATLQSQQENRSPNSKSVRSSLEKHAVSQGKAPTIYEAPESISSIEPFNSVENNVKTRVSERQVESESKEALENRLSSQDVETDINAPDSEGFPWIVKAARDGDEPMLQRLLKSEADIKAVHSTTKRHALSEASLQGHESLVDLLIREGAPLEHTDADSCTALHHACRRGELAIAKKLLGGNAAIDAPGPDGQTPLHLAIAAPHQNIAMLLLQRQANVNARDAYQRTALHLSALQGNFTMCTHLLDHGAQLDNREVQSKTALQLACEMGHYDIVEMMLDRAKLKPKDLTFHTAFFAAVEHGHVRIAESFFQRGLKLKNLKEDSHKPITLAAKKGSIDMLELMIKQKCNVRDKDTNSWNALHHAAHYGHSHVVERLVAKDFTGKGATARKETPLILAVKGGHFTTVETLLGSTTATLLMADAHGEQPIHHACRNGSLDIFNLLISYGAKPGTSNWLGWYPIHIASAYGHTILVDRLIEQGSHVEEKLGTCSIKTAQTYKMVEDGYWAEARCPYPGSRPLHLACEFEHWDIASNLVAQRGADIHSKCSESWTPLHHAAFNGSSAMVLYLVNSGANVHAQTTEGKTPLELGFRLGGVPIPEAEKHSVSQILKEATEKTPKKYAIKMPSLRRGKTVEDKNNVVRAATTSMAMMANKPPNPRHMTSPPMMRFTPEMSFSPETLTKTPSAMTPAIQETPPTPAFVPPTSMNIEIPRADPGNFNKKNPLDLSTTHGSTDALSQKTQALLSRASSVGLNSIANFDKYSKEGLGRIQRQLEARRKKRSGDSGGSGAYNGNDDEFVGFVESEGEGEGKREGDGFMDGKYGTAIKGSGMSISGITMGGFDKYPSS